MRCLFTFVCVLALGVMGCSETAGSGGTTGSGGGGGDGGTGGMPECESAENCDDRNECTANVCADGICEFMSVENGTACDEANECTVGTCADGTCDATPVADDTACGDDAGTCQQGSCRVACDEQGIRDAIAAGGGPYTFDCDGPTTLVSEMGIGIDNDVILDGESNLTVEVTGFSPVFFVTNVTAELRGFSIVEGSGYGATGISNADGGNLTLADSAVFAGGRGGGASIGNGGTMLMVNSTVSGNQSDAFEIRNCGELTMINSTVFGATGRGIESDVACPSSLAGGAARLTNSIVVGGCEGVVTSAGYNIESPGNSCGFTEEGDQANVSTEDLKLGPLQDNGGGTMTHALGAGSVAIDHIPAVDCEVDQDQRGVERPQGPECDVGAFEVQP